MASVRASARGPEKACTILQLAVLRPYFSTVAPGVRYKCCHLNLTKYLCRRPEKYSVWCSEQKQMYITYKIDFFARWYLTYMYVVPAKPQPTPPGIQGDTCARQLEVHTTTVLATLRGNTVHSGPNLGSPPLNFGLATTNFCLQRQNSVVLTTTDPIFDGFTTAFGFQRQNSVVHTTTDPISHRITTDFGFQRQNSVVHTTTDPVSHKFTTDFGLQSEIQWYSALSYNKILSKGCQQGTKSVQNLSTTTLRRRIRKLLKALRVGN